MDSVAAVIPAWNAASTLPRTLNSVAAQTHRVDEVIVVDDGSADATAEVAAAQGAHVLGSGHRGPAAARNRGWRSTDATWIAFCDADDEWLPHRVAAGLARARETGASLVYGDALRVTAGVAGHRWSDELPPVEGDALAALLMLNVICQSTVLVRQEVLNGVGGYDESMTAWEDIDLWLRIARQHPLAYVPDVLVRYHMGAGTLSGHSHAMAEGRLRSVTAALAWPDAARVPHAVRRRALGNALLMAAEDRYLRVQPREARRLLARAVMSSPSLTREPAAWRVATRSMLPAGVLRAVRTRRSGGPAMGGEQPTDDIDVVVPTYRRPDYLARCLAGLRAQTLPPRRVVVAARDSDEETHAVLVPLLDDQVRQVIVRRPGVVAAMTGALEDTSSPIIAFIDDDAVPSPTWIEQLRAHFHDVGLGAVGGRDVIPGETGSRQRVVGVRTWYGRVIGNHHLGYGPPRPVDYLKGVNMAFRREALALPPVGLLRGEGAEVHWEMYTCAAARRRGWRLVYDPEIEVRHDVAPRYDVDARGAMESDELLHARLANRAAASVWEAPARRILTTLWLLTDELRRPTPRRLRRVARAYKVIRWARADAASAGS